MKTRVVEYKDDDVEVRLTVAGPANTRMGMYRSLLMETERESIKAALDRENGSGEIQNPTMEMAAENLLRGIFYPAFIAATREQEGFDHWPITSAEFLELPEGLMIEWERAVWELNPRWAELHLPPKEDVEALEKKARRRRAGSSRG